MKKIVLFILGMLVGVQTFASTASKTKNKASSPRTDIRFNGTEVSGKYQVAGEAVAIVENEKPLIDMIEPRRDFKDRLRKSVTQR